MTAPSLFEVQAKFRYGIRGLAIVVQVTERQKGTNDVYLAANTFQVDLGSVSGVVKALSSARRIALKRDLYNNPLPEMLEGDYE
jgi:hypothetical protein